MKCIRRIFSIIIFLSLSMFANAEFKNPSFWQTFNPQDFGIGTVGEGYFGAVYDGQYVFFVPFWSHVGPHGEFLRYDTTVDFTVASSWEVYDPGADSFDTLGFDPDGYSGAAFDDRYIYFAPYNDGGNPGIHGQVLRYDTTNLFTSISSWSIYDPTKEGKGKGGYSGAIFDGTYVYFVPMQKKIEGGIASYGEVLRLNTNGNYEDIASWDNFDAESLKALGKAIDPRGYSGAVFDGRYIYFIPHMRSPNNYHSEVLRYDTKMAFLSTDSWSTYTPQSKGGYQHGVFDGRYIYFAPLKASEFHAEVLRYDTQLAPGEIDPDAHFKNPDSWKTFDPTEHPEHPVGKDGYAGAVFDGQYIYFVPWYDPQECFHGNVLRFDTLLDFENIDSWDAFDPGANGVGTDPDGYFGGVFDGKYVYFAPQRNECVGYYHGEILRYKAKSTIPALVDIEPDTLNKKSGGIWLTAYITLSDEHDPSQIVASSINITTLTGQSCPSNYSQPTDINFTPQVGDRDEDGIPDLTVKFDRQVLLSNICLDDVAITIEGDLTTGEHFSGTDMIRVIDRGK